MRFTVSQITSDRMLGGRSLRIRTVQTSTVHSHTQQRMGRHTLLLSSGTTASLLMARRSVVTISNGATTRATIR
jgi:hypothetical protein